MRLHYACCCTSFTTLSCSWNLLGLPVGKSSSFRHSEPLGSLRSQEGPDLAPLWTRFLSWPLQTPCCTGEWVLYNFIEKRKRRFFIKFFQSMGLRPFLRFPLNFKEVSAWRGRKSKIFVLLCSVGCIAGLSRLKKLLTWYPLSQDHMLL